MLFVILFFFQAIKFVAALPGYSTSGTEFVIGYPTSGSENLRGNMTLMIVFTTDELFAVVTLAVPNSQDNSWEKSSFRLTRFETSIYTLDLEHQLLESDIASVTYIKSKGPVKVLVTVTSPEHRQTEAYLAIPESSCHKWYYATTDKSFPFIMIISFSKKTSLEIAFPELKGNMIKLNKKCPGNRDCSSGKSIQIELQPYNSWYFFVDEEKEIDLHHTSIKSNNPIFVLSGNSECNNAARNTSIDFCITPLVSVESWGKEYFVPYFTPNKVEKETNLNFRFNSVVFPFNVKIYSDDQMIDQQIKDFEVAIDVPTRKPIVISSKNKFGVSMFVRSQIIDHGMYSVGNSLLYLIPTEQWIDGTVLVDQKFIHSHYPLDSSNTIVVTIKSNIVILPNFPTGQFELKIMSTSTKRPFAWVALNFLTDKIRVYTKKPNNKVMVFRMKRHNEWSVAIWPLDHHHGVIYQDVCNPSLPVASDGLDNDCDGIIDEELQNKEDDDGDELVDEDFAETTGISQWTDWFSHCGIKCSGDNEVLNVRSCKVTRLSGHCQGHKVECKTGSKDKKNCCPTGCTKCNGVNATCDCKIGFKNDDYCLIPCPKNWKGIGCSIGPRLSGSFNYTAEEELEEDYFDIEKKVNVTKVEKPEPKTNWKNIAVYCSIAFMILTCIIGFIYFLRRSFKRRAELKAIKDQKDLEAAKEETAEESEEVESEEMTDEEEEKDEDGAPKPRASAVDRKSRISRITTSGEERTSRVERTSQERASQERASQARASQARASQARASQEKRPSAEARTSNVEEGGENVAP